MKKILGQIIPLIVLIILCIPIATSSIMDWEQKTQNEIILKQEQAEEKIYLLGKFDPAQRPDFALVPYKYAMGGNTIYLRRETLAAFEEMADVAALDNVYLRVGSGTRNFDYQKGIWEAKWTGAELVNEENLAETIPDGLERFEKILEYSAVPGTSRHHWGTDVDINDATLTYFNLPGGEKVYEWLKANAMQFGFCEPYNLKGSNRPYGYNEEKWHWTYLPLSRKFTEDYKNLITNADISGFLGDQYVADQDLINNYVLGINSDCI